MAVSLMPSRKYTPRPRYECKKFTGDNVCEREEDRNQQIKILDHRVYLTPVSREEEGRQIWEEEVQIGALYSRVE